MVRTADVLIHFKISKVTLYKWLKKGCPVHRVGKLVFFDIPEIEAWVKKGA